MDRIANLLNFSQLGKFAGVNPNSLRSIWSMMKSGKIKNGASPLLKKTEEALNNELCTYISSDKYETLRVCAMAGLLIDPFGDQRLFFDHQTREIFVIEEGKKPAKLTKDSPQLDLIYYKLFGKLNP